MPRKLTWEEREVRELWDVHVRLRRFFQPAQLRWTRNAGAALEPEPAIDELLSDLKEPLLHLLAGVKSRLVSPTWAFLIRTSPIDLLMLEHLGGPLTAVKQATPDAWDDLLDLVWSERTILPLPTHLSDEADFLSLKAEYMISLMRQRGTEPASSDEKAVRVLVLDALLLDTRLRRFWAVAAYLQPQDIKALMRALLPFLFWHQIWRDLQAEKRIQKALVSILQHIPVAEMFPELQAEASTARQQVESMAKLHAASEGRLPLSELTHEETVLLSTAAIGSRPDFPQGEEYVRQVRGAWRGLSGR